MACDVPVGRDGAVANLRFESNDLFVAPKIFPWVAGPMEISIEFR